MVGIQDLHKHSRGSTRPLYVLSSSHAGLQPMEGPRAPEARYCRVKKSVVWAQERGMEDDEAPNLLVCTLWITM